MKPEEYVPISFTQWKREGDVWTLAVGGYKAKIEFVSEEEDAFVLCEIEGPGCSAGDKFEALEDGLSWCEDQIAFDCANTIQRIGEAKLARFVQRSEIYEGETSTP